jgi:hypothetical protein
MSPNPGLHRGSVLRKETWREPLDGRRAMAFAFGAMAIFMAFVSAGEWSSAQRRAERESFILQEDVQPNTATAVAAGSLSALAGTTSLVLNARKRQRSMNELANSGGSGRREGFAALDGAGEATHRQSVVAQLAEAARLHADGALTDEEFRALKSRLIGGPEERGHG